MESHHVTESAYRRLQADLDSVMLEKAQLQNELVTAKSTIGRLERELTSKVEGQESIGQPILYYNEDQFQHLTDALMGSELALTTAQQVKTLFLCTPFSALSHQRL